MDVPLVPEQLTVSAPAHIAERAEDCGYVHHVCPKCRHLGLETDADGALFCPACQWPDLSSGNGNHVAGPSVNDREPSGPDEADKRWQATLEAGSAASAEPVSGNGGARRAEDVARQLRAAINGGRLPTEPKITHVMSELRTSHRNAKAALDLINGS